MNPQRQRRTGCLVPALALQPLDFVYAAEDGLDTLIERRDVGILRQALQHSFKVEVWVPVRNLGEQPGHGPPVEYPGFFGQGGRPVGVKPLQGADDLLKIYGQVGVGAQARFWGVPHLRHPHNGQLIGDRVCNGGKAPEPAFLARLVVLEVGGLVHQQLLLRL